MRRYAALPRRKSHCAHGVLAQFGDGIQSMIDCQVTVDKKEDPKGDRVVVTFEYVDSSLAVPYCEAHVLYSGKFLKYSQW